MFKKTYHATHPDMMKGAANARNDINCDCWFQLWDIRQRSVNTTRLIQAPPPNSKRFYMQSYVRCRIWGRGWRHGSRKLHVIQPRVGTVHAHQLFMGSLFLDSLIGQDQDAFGVPDGG